MKALKRILILLVGAALVALALANRQAVSLHAPLFPEIALEVPLYLLFFAAMALGVLFSALVITGKRLKQAGTTRHYRKDIKKLEHEVALLKVDKQVKEQAGK